MVTNPLTIPQRNSISAINMKGTQKYWYVEDEHGTQHAVCGPSFNNGDCSHFSTFCYHDEKKAHAQVEFTLLLEAQCRCGR